MVSIHRILTRLWESNSLKGQHGYTFSSISDWFSAKWRAAVVNFTTFGTETCLWNSEISVAAVKIRPRRRRAAFRVGRGSFLLGIKLMRWGIQVARSISRTESRGNATPIQDCAQSIITFRDRREVLYARQRPAHRPPDSFEWSKAWILVVHFVNWGDGRTDSAVNDDRQWGRYLTADASEDSCNCSKDLRWAPGSMVEAVLLKFCCIFFFDSVPLKQKPPKATRVSNGSCGHKLAAQPCTWVFCIHMRLSLRYILYSISQYVQAAKCSSPWLGTSRISRYRRL